MQVILHTSCFYGGDAIIIIIMALTLYQSRVLRLTLVGAGACIALAMPTAAYAASANVSYSYKSNQPIASGSLVSLDPSNKNTIQVANSNNAKRILGIVVNSNDSLLAVDTGKGKVQVATSGKAGGLVSNFNGNINVGDQIAVSPFDGIGMKANGDDYVVGLAQTALDGHTKGVQVRTVKDGVGSSKQLFVGSIIINIATGIAGSGADQKLNSLQKIVHSITGRTITTWRIISALTIIGLTVVALIVLIYSSIYSTIISIGRNPLAKYAVYHSLTTVLTTAFITASVAMGLAFLLLR